MPTAVYGFTDDQPSYTSQCSIIEFKDFNSPLPKLDSMLDHFAAIAPILCGNDDPNALNWAAHKLLHRKEQRKILIVLSDGAPASEWHGHPDYGSKALKNLCHHIEASHQIDLIGVGIKSTAVKEYYKNYIVLDDLNELTPKMFGILKEMM